MRVELLKLGLGEERLVRVECLELQEPIVGGLVALDELQAKRECLVLRHVAGLGHKLAINEILDAVLPKLVVIWRLEVDLPLPGIAFLPPYEVLGGVPVVLKTKCTEAHTRHVEV